MARHMTSRMYNVLLSAVATGRLRPRIRDINSAAGSPMILAAVCKST